MANIFFNDLGIVCALGNSVSAVRDGLFSHQPFGLRTYSEWDSEVPIWLGKVDVENADIAFLPEQQQSRNNAILFSAFSQIQASVAQAISKFGRKRIGVVLGSSTSGIAETENRIRHNARNPSSLKPIYLALQEMGSPAVALANALNLTGPAMVISTACSSSAKAIASAARLLKAGICDAVIAGGADSLCQFTVAGFSALDSISTSRCNPFSSNRNGINIGEGAALFLMSREPGPVELKAWFENSDAHHISAPDPSGIGAINAMRGALARADLNAKEIDYLNLHGTGTIQNDAMESSAVNTVFGTGLALSSTKPLTGHTLGAAGAIEAAISLITLIDNPDGHLPVHWWDGEIDPDLPALNLIHPGQKLNRPLDFAMSNSFAFGGNNISLVFGRNSDVPSAR